MLVDSNILVNAINNDSPKQAAARKFLLKYQNRGLVVAHQNILETLRVLTHSKFPNPMTGEAAIREVGDIIRAFQVIAPDNKAHLIALKLISKHRLTGDKIFDAYLAATAMAAGIDTIATDNTKDFTKFLSVITHNPFTKSPIT